MAAGATLEREVTEHAYGKLALLADPFGNGFCLIEFSGRGYDEIATRRARERPPIPHAVVLRASRVSGFAHAGGFAHDPRSRAREGSRAPARRPRRRSPARRRNRAAARLGQRAASSSAVRRSSTSRPYQRSRKGLRRHRPVNGAGQTLRREMSNTMLRSESSPLAARMRSLAASAPAASARRRSACRTSRRRRPASAGGQGRARRRGRRRRRPERGCRPRRRSPAAG